MRLILCLFCVIASFFLHAKPLELELHAPAAIVMNADTGAILLEKKAHTPLYPASITKIATALYFLDKNQLPLHQTVTVSGDALKMKSSKNPEPPLPHWLESDGTRMGLVKGEILSLDALLHGLMLVSGNDAANVLAEVASGSVPLFVEEMNHYVQKLGCRNTQFKNPHGLHDPEHFTTAYDICLIAQQALRIPKFREIVSKTFYAKPKTNKHPQEEISQHNSLLKSGKYHYPKAIGMKTGYHSAAKNTLVAAATHEGRTLIVVLLSCEKRTDRYEDAIRIFETAFQEKKESRRLMGPEHIFNQAIAGAKTSLKAALAKEIVLSFYPSEEPNYKAFVHWDALRLPIRKNQRVGEVRVLDLKGEVLQREELVALDEVRGTFFSFLQDKLGRLFK